MPNMTNAEYVGHGGNACPYCKSDTVEACGSAEFDSDYAVRKVECTTCEKTWQDVYSLTGWTPE